jgi:hypothetical protein
VRVVAYDSTGTYAGTVAGNDAHYDLTVDKDGTQWWVGGLGTGYGFTAQAVGKAKIPNGYNLWRAGQPNGIVDLMPWGFNISGLHVSGRGFRTGWALVSADEVVGSSGTRVPFSREMVRVFLDSRRQTAGTPHFERLAGHAHGLEAGSTGRRALCRPISRTRTRPSAGTAPASSGDRCGTTTRTAAPKPT